MSGVPGTPGGSPTSIGLAVASAGAVGVAALATSPRIRTRRWSSDRPLVKTRQPVQTGEQGKKRTTGRLRTSPSLRPIVGFLHNVDSMGKAP
jgi:hypothetical protein